MTYAAPLPSMGSLFAPTPVAPSLGGGDAAPFPWMSSLFGRTSLRTLPAYAIDARPRAYAIKTATTRRAHPVIYRDHFSAKDPAESLVLTFDFGALASSVTAPVVTAERYSGAADSAPEAMISGAAQVDGAKVLQRVVGGVAGCTYVMRARCNTADGSVLVEAGLLPVEAAR
jgi:hypothetical protein